MVVVSSLLALVFGLSLGLLFENILVLVGVTLVIPCLFWSFRIFPPTRATHRGNPLE